MPDDAVPDPAGMPDLNSLSLPELIALGRALGIAVAAAQAAQAAKASWGGDFECALLADDEGVTVSFSVLTTPQPIKEIAS